MEAIDISVNPYKEFSSDEISLIANFKRFTEYFYGDPLFKYEIENKSEKCKKMMDAVGIKGVDLVQYYIFKEKYYNKELREIGSFDIREEDTEVFPQIVLWKRWIDYLDLKTKEKSYVSILDKQYMKWRDLQINRCKSQIPNSKDIIHALVAFELSDGCSRNCHFCGLSSDILRGIFEFNEDNLTLWRKILKYLYDRFGDISSDGVCYWGTEPSDNPYYLSFIKEFGDITGNYPQTTTAVAAYKDDFISRLIDFRKRHLTDMDRFSVLSLKELHTIFKKYTAEDLIYVKLLFQYEEAEHSKFAYSGRKRDTQYEDELYESIRDYTICCVSGYIINMVKKDIRLITPCPPSDKYPFGYMTLAEGYFEDFEELKKFIETTIEYNMTNIIDDNKIVSFRDDLEFSKTENGFCVKTKYHSFSFSGELYLSRLGEMIEASSYSIRELVSELNDQYKNVFKILLTIDNLKNKALIVTN